MLINSFENQTNLAEWFEHRNHYSVVVTRHKDLKRTEYKIQKNDHVYDMLKVKASVTALVSAAKSLADNFPPITTTDTKSESCVIADESVGVVASEGEALSTPFKIVRLEKSIARRCDRFINALQPFSNKTINISVLKPVYSDDPQVSPLLDDDIPHFGLGV